MSVSNKKPTTIAQYIASAPKESQEKLRQIYECIAKSAPDAQEGLKWSMPAFSYTRILVMFAGFRHHVGFYPTPSAVKAFEKELKKYKIAKGSIQFPLDTPLPLALIKKITAFRIKEEKKEGGTWRSK